jgi:myo-inositol 2-dehydrogenase/D-chiro-inositol 1-dehydrogenase
VELRVAIVGCGRMGRERAAAATKLGAKVVTAVDSDPGAAEQLARLLPDCATAADASELDWPSLDAVFVCTPPFARGSVELAAVAAAVPVFMEKPVGLSRDQCLPLAAALERTPCLTAVGYMNRYRESVAAARRLLTDRTVLGVSCSWVTGPYGVSWWSEESLSGGCVNEQTTHLVDMTRYLVGEVAEVQAMASFSAGPPSTVEAASFNLRLTTGQLCSMLYSCQADTKMVDFQVFTDKGTVRLEGWDFQLVGGGIAVDADRSQIFLREVSAFFRAVTAGRNGSILCDFRDALRTQQVVDALRGSLQKGTVERVPA